MSRKLPPLNALRAFEAAARHASFSSAADELNVTHSAISQQIRHLEEYFQQPLFRRSRARVSLNHAGALLFPEISHTLDRIAMAGHALSENIDPRSLTINTTAAFAAQWLIPKLSDFECIHPEIRVHLAPSSRFSEAHLEQCDIAIRWASKGSSCGNRIFEKNAEKLLYVDTFCACSPKLLKGNNRLVTAADLATQTLIHHDDGSAWRIMLKALGVSLVTTTKNTFYSDSSLALQTAIDGKGIIVAGSIIAAQALASGQLILPFEAVIRKRHFYQLYFSSHAKSRIKVQQFTAWVHAQAAQSQA